MSTDREKEKKSKRRANEKGGRALSPLSFSLLYVRSSLLRWRYLTELRVLPEELLIILISVEWNAASMGIWEIILATSGERYLNLFILFFLHPTSNFRHCWCFFPSDPKDFWNDFLAENRRVIRLEIYNRIIQSREASATNFFSQSTRTQDYQAIWRDSRLCRRINFVNNIENKRKNRGKGWVTSTKRNHRLYPIKTANIFVSIAKIPIHDFVDVTRSLQWQVFYFHRTLQNYFVSKNILKRYDEKITKFRIKKKKTLRISIKDQKCFSTCLTNDLGERDSTILNICDELSLLFIHIQASILFTRS